MSWLTELIDRLLCWIPRIVLINPDEGGVIITCGKRVRPVSSGIYIVWPLLQECVTVTMTPQVVDLRPQSIMTSESDMCVSGGIMYRIKAPEKAILRVQNFDESLQILALGIIARHLSAATIGTNYVEELSNQILRGVKEAARGWGLEILRVYITDLGHTKNIRLLSNAPVTTMVPIEE